MKVFIFGAGASVGSQKHGNLGHASFISPLTDDIFDDKYFDSAEKASLNKEKLNIIRDSNKKAGWFEEWLTNEWGKLDTKKGVYLQSQKTFLGRITFYIWNLLHTVSVNGYKDANGYASFLSKVNDKEEDFGIISFNYDTLLDRAYEKEFGINLSSIDDYLDSNFIKPHGSVNWLLPKRDDDPLIDLNVHNADVKHYFKIAGEKIFDGGSLAFHSIKIVPPDTNIFKDPWSLMSAYFEGQYFYPLIFLPLLSKEYEFIQGFQNEIIRKGSHLLSEAKEIYFIGYKASDDIIQEMCKYVQSGTKINVVGTKNADDTMDKILAWGGKLGFIKGDIFTEGFFEFVTVY